MAKRRLRTSGCGYFKRFTISVIIISTTTFRQMRSTLVLICVMVYGRCTAATRSRSVRRSTARTGDGMYARTRLHGTHTIHC